MVSLRVSRASLVVASLALTLGVAACSGSEQSPPPAAGGSATSASPAPSSAAAGGAGAAAGASTFCALVKDQSNTLTSQKASELMAADSPEAWKAFFDETAAKNQALVDAAPSEIKKDVETVNATSKVLRAEMERVGYDVKKVDASKISSLSSPATLAASKKLGDYAKNECGIDLSSATP